MAHTQRFHTDPQYTDRLGIYEVNRYLGNDLFFLKVVDSSCEYTFFDDMLLPTHRRGCSPPGPVLRGVGDL